MGIKHTTVFIIPPMHLEEMGAEILHNSLVIISAFTKGGNAARGCERKKQATGSVRTTSGLGVPILFWTSVDQSYLLCTSIPKLRARTNQTLTKEQYEVNVLE